MSTDEQRRLDAAFAAHKRDQARRALSMTMAERLDWLDDALDEFGELHGIAARPAPRAPNQAAAIARMSGRHHHSYADYLALEETANIKLEYHAGEIFARPGGTPRHAALTMNIGIALLGARERGGRVYSSDLRVRVLATGFAAHPDVTVIRGPMAPDPESRTTAVNPRVIVEVLDEATEEFDRMVKAEHYRQIPSLRACLLVSHRRPHIEAWQRRGDDEGWTMAEYGAGDSIELRAVGVTFTVDEVYRGC
ncbi:MAG TPA: Uma2 family endonuclease [Enhygromyxa sp.]|nr:Uma2 family endonuclease [Enhygromyxa sp.]